MPAEASVKKYESWELRPKWFLIGLALLVIGAGILGFVLMTFYQHMLHRAAGESVARSVVQGQRSPSEAPPLQPQVGHEMIDAQDLAAMRQHEGQIFDKLGWKWDESRQQHDIPVAVIEAVKNRSSATQPSGRTSAERGAP